MFYSQKWQRHRERQHHYYHSWDWEDEKESKASMPLKMGLSNIPSCVGNIDLDSFISCQEVFQLFLNLSMYGDEII